MVQKAVAEPDKLNVLTIHAEVEGIVCLEMFRQFLGKAAAKDISFVPLGTLLQEFYDINLAAVIRDELPGREGWISRQGPPQYR